MTSVESLSPRAHARLAGALYLVSAVPAGFSVYVLMKLVVRDDPAATAANILGSESLFRFGFAADQVGILFFVGAMVFLYQLLKPVDGSLARLMLLFSLIGAVVQAFNSLQDFAALALLKDGPSLASLSTGHAQALAYLFIKLHLATYDLAMVFYGSWAVMVGCIILRSALVPRILGALLVIDGCGYLTHSFAAFLAPSLAAALSPYVPMLTALLGEFPLMVWLIVKGVEVR